MFSISKLSRYMSFEIIGQTAPLGAFLQHQAVLQVKCKD